MRRALAFLVALLSIPVIAAGQAPSPVPSVPAPVAPAPVAPPTVPPAPQPAPSATIEDGATVQLEYTLSDDAGKLLDTNKGQEPLTYMQGGQQIIAGLERQLAGMQIGQAKKVVLKPEEAFGPVDPAAQTEVPKDALPPDALVVGTQLMARNASGEGRPVIVKEIKEKTVVVDLNHPLAGKTLVFDVKVLRVEPPSKTDAPKSEGPTPTK
jgi:FKBP-type peptidyl-prolyl cis-trans isomerase SlyD